MLGDDLIVQEVTGSTAILDNSSAIDFDVSANATAALFASAIAQITGVVQDVSGATALARVLNSGTLDVAATCECERRNRRACKCVSLRRASPRNAERDRRHGHCQCQ